MASPAALATGLTIVPQLVDGFGKDVENTEEGAVLGAEMALKLASLFDVSGGEGETDERVALAVSAPDQAFGCCWIWTGAKALCRAGASSAAPSSMSTR